jgi:hypothetical protein
MRQLKKRQPGSSPATPTTGDGTHRRRWLRVPTSGAALAVSIVALVVAMAGSAYAGVTLANNSVGTRQLQNGAVTNGKIAKSAVGNAKIANGAVGPAKLKSGLIVPNAVHANVADLATNATNATNATKATTATSATSATTATNATTAANATALAKVTYVQSANVTSPAGGGTVNNPSDTLGAVGCPSGTSAIAGGFTTSKAGLEINESEPTFNSGATKPATGWDGFVDNFTNVAGTFSVWAICTPVTAGNSQPGAVPITKAASSR